MAWPAASARLAVGVLSVVWGFDHDQQYTKLDCNQYNGEVIQDHLGGWV
jgi:hypothetical protein